MLYLSRMIGNSGPKPNCESRPALGSISRRFRKRNGLLSNYLFGSQGFINGSVQKVSHLYNADKKDFGPRIGFAWSPQVLGKEDRSSRWIRHSLQPPVPDRVQQYSGRTTPFAAQVNICPPNCFFDPGKIVGPPPGSGILTESAQALVQIAMPPIPISRLGWRPMVPLCKMLVALRSRKWTSLAL